MPITDEHPLYTEKSDSYKIMTDTSTGEERIKEGAFAYLSATGGQIEDGALSENPRAKGLDNYRSYKSRARFPDLVEEAVETLVGVMVQEPAVIDLPPQLEPLREDATRKHESLQAMLRRTLEQQLLFGRIGWLVDTPRFVLAGDRELPHFVEYDAQMIINWDDERIAEMSTDTLNLVVLNESKFTRGKNGADMFAWQTEDVHRVLLLEPEEPELPVSDVNPIVYKTFTQTDDITDETVVPEFIGVKLNRIPFTFIGANDLNINPDDIPLLSLARLALHIYGLSADYYNALHGIGSDTLVIKGTLLNASGDEKDVDASVRVGTGAVIYVETDGDAGFEGIDSKGIPEQAKAYQADLLEGREHGARLLEPRRGQAESGEALRTRVASATANLHQIMLTAAAGLEQALKTLAEWVGADASAVKVTPNMDFVQIRTDPAQLVSFMAAKAQGAPISLESIHAWSLANNFTRETFTEELLRIDKEISLREAEPEPDDDVDPDANSDDEEDDADE